jgi:hypothetical protein
MSLSKGSARTRVHVEPDSKARPSYEEAPGVHSGPKALLPETTARDERQAGIKQLTTKISTAKKTTAGVSLADVKRKREEASSNYGKAMKKIDTYQVREAAQIAIDAFGSDEAGVAEVAKARRKYARLQRQVTTARELADVKRGRSKRKYDAQEAFLEKHETDVTSLKKLKRTHSVAAVTNATKRGAAKVAKVAGKIASAVVGHDPEGKDVDVVA